MSNYQPDSEVQQETQAEAQNTDINKGPITGNEIQSKAPKQPTVRSKKSRKADSAFRTISEVADVLDVQQHVLRFWETKFSQIRPLKRGGGRRYYRPEDLELLKRIHHLLYTEGYTIKGVQKLLREKGKAGVLKDARAVEAENSNAPQNVSTTVKGQLGGGMSAQQRSTLKNVVGELKALRDYVSSK